MDDVEDKAVDKGLSMSNHRCEFTYRFMGIK